MKQISVSSADLKIELRNKKLNIWDFIRRRWVAFTPEEMVRQLFSLWMVKDLGYPQAQLGHEISLELNGMQRRADAVFYDHHGHPLIILEFKASNVTISQKTFDQISRYNQVMQVPLLIVSNGKQIYCCHVEKEKIEFLNEIPSYDELQSIIELHGKEKGDLRSLMSINE